MHQPFARTRIKVCGIRSYELALAAIDAGADAIGFVFVRNSPRFIEPTEAAEIMANLPPFVATVGVFEDQSIEEFLDIEEACPTTYTQLDGSEPERFVRQVGPDVIRSIRFDPEATPQALLNWDAVDEVGAIRIDATQGDASAKFDWAQLPPMLDDVAKPIVLAGGLGSTTIGDAIRVVRPYAVDVITGGDEDPGRFEEVLAEICHAARRADCT